MPIHGAPDILSLRLQCPEQHCDVSNTDGLQMIEDITEDTLLPILSTAQLGRTIHAFRECDSTNTFAKRLLEGNRPPDYGTLIITDYQRAGYGRNARAWKASRGLSLLFSLILYPDEWQSSLSGRATMAASLAVIQAARIAGVPDCAVKWPNDVLSSDGRKLSGILTEQVSREDGTRALIAGIGININQSDTDFPAILRESATSFRLLLGRPASRLQILKNILECLEKALQLPDEALFAAWQNSCLTPGRTVRVRLAGRTVTAQALAVEKDGGLILRHSSGQLEVIHSGDLEEIRMT